MRLLRASLSSPLFTKVSSGIIGFLLWSSINGLFTQTTWVTLPISFYNKANKQIDTVDSVSIELSAQRSYLRQLSLDNLAVHIDANTLKLGDNQIKVSPEQLFLPDTISINAIIPEQIIITLLPEEDI